jgi:hypothetical protein
LVELSETVGRVVIWLRKSCQQLGKPKRVCPHHEDEIPNKIGRHFCEISFFGLFEFSFCIFGSQSTAQVDCCFWEDLLGDEEDEEAEEDEK